MCSYIEIEAKKKLLHFLFHYRQNNVELQRAIAAHSENLKLLAMPLTHITQEICGDFINPS